ncbi:MAG: hypothetical protein J6033_03880 [Lachnospiraceae bacterium]|nr:hypothetical protein [Lachnospiraceae bacterium]
MKKYGFLICVLSVFSLLTFTACGQNASDSALASFKSTEPPIMSVTSKDGESLSERAKSYEWNLDNGDGTVSSTVADGAEPTFAYERHRYLENPGEIILTFEVKPTKMNVNAYVLKENGEFAEPVNVKVKDGVIEPIDSETVLYVVDSAWSGKGSTGGNGEYAFVIYEK